MDELESNVNTKVEDDDDHDLKERQIVHNEKLKEVETLLRKVGNNWKCKICDKTFRYRAEVRYHAEIHVEGLSYQCLINLTY